MTDEWMNKNTKINIFMKTGTSKTTITFSLQGLFSLYTKETQSEKAEKLFENIQKRWTGRKDKWIALIGERGGGSISDQIFSLGQHEDVYQGNVIISGRSCFLLATPRQTRQPGEEARKWGVFPLNSCPSLIHHMPTHCHNKPAFKLHKNGTSRTQTHSF